MRGFNASDLDDCTDLPSPSGSPSRSCRKSGHDSTSFEKLTAGVCTRALLDQTLRRNGLYTALKGYLLAFRGDMAANDRVR
jgi:hypothetical protein